MLSMEFIKSGEKTYQQQIKDLEEQVNFFKNKSQRVEKTNKKLKDNWNELKNWCKENQYNDNFDSYQVDNYTTYGVIVKKMEELESGNNES